MALTLTQNYTAISPGITASFLPVGGTAPYTLSVVPGGCGGTINSASGIYTPPSSVSTNPATISDIIKCTDSASGVVTASILVGTPLLLLCDIIQNQMGLANGRVYLWDQKIIAPTDNGLFVAVSEESVKIFGNNLYYDLNGNSISSVNCMANIGIDIISRGPAARDQKELVVAALVSQYSNQQQEANSFLISRVSTNFINLSEIEGAAIPYRFRISCALHYAIQNTTAIGYYNTFTTPTVAVNS